MIAALGSIKDNLTLQEEAAGDHSAASPELAAEPLQARPAEPPS